jgi:hypothetical protein
VPQDSLNHQFGHAQAVEIAPQATPASVPAVPLGKGTVALEIVPNRRCSDSGFRQTSHRFSAGRITLLTTLAKGKPSGEDYAFV